QVAMAQQVTHALNEGDHLLVEAGTGTGKTLAYLVPALLDGRRVVVSTGTRMLQDQIMAHDVPLLERALGRPIAAACLKGLSNYVCRRRYEEFRRGASGDGALAHRTLPVLEPWVEATGTGDRAELRELPEDSPVWSAIHASPETRIGPKCDHYDACFVAAARRRAEGAELVVVNHHLYFADLALRGPHGGGILPEHDLVVFDEAHQLEDTLTAFFGVGVSSARVERLVRDAEGAFVASGDASSGPTLAREAARAASVFFDAIPARAPLDGARLPLPKALFTGGLEASMFAFDNALEALGTQAKLSSPPCEPLLQIARRAQRLRDDVAVIAEGGRGAHVTWTETRGRRVSIGASPVDVSSIFRDEVLHRSGAVVLTSATLATAGSFSFLRRQLGIEEGATELVLDSPFDYPTQAGLYLPEGLPDPRDARFLAGAADAIVELVTASGGGAFVLSTSLRAMESLHRAVAARVAFPALVQGQAPKAALLEQFQADRRSILFATASFWEGVDVPGDALRLVIIDKLPFDVPTDPLIVARCQRLEEQGEQPFIRYLVPSAALALKQGFGRLIRAESDRGVVAILDPRLRTKGYGKVLLRALPPARRFESMEEVRAFYQGASA
ncbi:MAG: ATP-dependent DNA helicase, partial [Myxococcales bacterium]|nr:ATP-dependent DNA helicase [Myxococcales bacterium]